MRKWVYDFNEGNIGMKNLLGEKGTNLVELTNLGLPVPKGFTITTEACTKYYEDNKKITDEIRNQINEYIVKLEKATNKKFNDKENPLLISVRNGSRQSIPGIMGTITNIGLNEEVVNILAKSTKNPYYAWDSYKKFIEDYATIVMQLPKEVFEKITEKVKEEKRKVADSGLNANDLKVIVDEYKKEYKQQTGKQFPENPKEQLMEVIKTIFELWNSQKAILYRKDNNIPNTWGTAITIQEIKGNSMDNNYSRGKIFTRNPETGEKNFFGEIVTNTKNIINSPINIFEIENKHPKEFEKLKKICKNLERKEKDMQEIEFAIENDKLYILQSRTGKRTAYAALNIACDLVDEGISIETNKMFDQKDVDFLDNNKQRRKETKSLNAEDINNYNANYVNLTSKPIISEKELIKVDEQIKKLIKRKQ